MAIPTPPLHNKHFRILIKTENGNEHSWMGNRDTLNASSVGIFANNNNNNRTLSDVVADINKMVKCTYLDRKQATVGIAGSGEDIENFWSGSDDRFDGANNPWLTAHAGDDGKVGFRHTDSTDISDPFAKVKFFGSNVCSVLGFPEDVWIHASGFNLSVNPNIESSFKGVVNATELNVDGFVNFSPNARSAGKMFFDVSGSESNDMGVFMTVGTTIFGRYGYDTFTSGSLVQVDLVRSTGDVVAVYSSDEKLKDNVEYILDPISKVNQLNGVEFEWNSLQKAYPAGTKDIGIIAQDLQKVYPELVSTGSHGYLGINSYGKLTGLLIEAVKEQSKQIADLQYRIKKLEDK